MKRDCYDGSVLYHTTIQKTLFSYASHFSIHLKHSGPRCYNDNRLTSTTKVAIDVMPLKS